MIPFWSDAHQDAGYSKSTGAHAAAASALVPASHRLDAWLGGATDDDDSFPLMGGGHLPADRMFFAALTSLS